MKNPNGNIQKFEVALGEEDGNLFAAILWPDTLGDIPFAAPVGLAFTQDGFVLFGDNDKDGLYFSGIDKPILEEMGVRHVVVLKPTGNDYVQLEVSKTNEPIR
ncbi:hypothetical protein P5704_028380 (plasmid) [Pseudomonas sp. FeN3W]|nr:hypothetical protein P5704_028380 [Pseudomonas sp. FeN3W]